jgi:glycosyltransferase involved in cell wall biosynthesis
VSEVLDNTAPLFDGEDAQALARLIGRVMDDGPFRDGIVAAGKARAPQFTWSQSAVWPWRRHRP